MPKITDVGAFLGAALQGESPLIAARSVDPDVRESRPYMNVLVDINATDVRYSLHCREVIFILSHSIGIGIKFDNLLSFNPLWP